MQATWMQNGNGRSVMPVQQCQMAPQPSQGYDHGLQHGLNSSRVESIQADYSTCGPFLEDHRLVDPGYLASFQNPNSSLQAISCDGNEPDVEFFAGKYDSGSPYSTQSVPPLPQAQSCYTPVRPTFQPPDINGKQNSSHPFSTSRNLEVSDIDAAQSGYHSPMAHMIGAQVCYQRVPAKGSAGLFAFGACYSGPAPANNFCPDADAVIAMPMHGVLQETPTQNPLPPLGLAPIVNNNPSYQPPEQLARKLGIPNEAWKDVNHCHDARFAMKLLASDEYTSATPKKKRILRKAWIEERIAQLENLGRKELNDLLERWDART